MTLSRHPAEGGLMVTLQSLMIESDWKDPAPTAVCCSVDTPKLVIFISNLSSGKVADQPQLLVPKE